MTRKRLPLPEPTDSIPLPLPGGRLQIWTADQMHAYADAETAALQAELLREHADHKQTGDDALLVLLENRTLIEKVRVLREALSRCEACTTNDAVGQQARAALEATK